jgi:hypothetical protein
MIGVELTCAERSRLLKLLRLLASNHLGECAAAGAAAHAFVEALGGWDRVIRPAAGGDRDLFICADRQRHLLGEWERAFLRSIGPKIRAGFKLSTKQQRQLHRITLEAEMKAAA